MINAVHLISIAGKFLFKIFNCYWSGNQKIQNMMITMYRHWESFQVYQSIIGDRVNQLPCALLSLSLRILFSVWREDTSICNFLVWFSKTSYNLTDKSSIFINNHSYNQDLANWFFICQRNTDLFHQPASSLRGHTPRADRGQTPLSWRLNKNQNDLMNMMNYTLFLPFINSPVQRIHFKINLKFIVKEKLTFT